MHFSMQNGRELRHEMHDGLWFVVIVVVAPYLWSRNHRVQSLHIYLSDLSQDNTRL